MLALGACCNEGSSVFGDSLGASQQQPALFVAGSTRISPWIRTISSGFVESLNGRGHIVQWAPRKQVLAHPAVGAFWTHNGWNSTLESVCEGVPMICMPCFTDQLVKARYEVMFGRLCCS
ncbi:UDP-glycosyltransferase 76F1-like [Prunus yedoensis var. nudiflora]|uniref:UDP-glycosyltransferase 76F1-like n=1 Tax=Prunus yedoensis var. nudiflora TaxID=2094558 RepID=A0A314XNV5_PRUYE|nr:UDP-glycosyltransferase 76F1-like [Prunus yedoensis var. nudiflora]